MGTPTATFATEEIGRTLRAARERAGLLQREVADQLRVPTGTVQRIEYGTFTRAAAVESYADLFGYDVVFTITPRAETR